MRTRAVSSSPRAHSIILYAAAPRASGRHGNRCETTTMVKPRATYVRSSGVSCRSECCPGCEKPSQPTVPRGSRSSPTAQGSKPPKPLAVRGSSRPGPELDLPMTYRPPSRGSRLRGSPGEWPSPQPKCPSLAPQQGSGPDAAVRRGSSAPRGCDNSSYRKRNERQPRPLAPIPADDTKVPHLDEAGFLSA